MFFLGANMYFSLNHIQISLVSFSRFLLSNLLWLVKFFFLSTAQETALSVLEDYLKPFFPNNILY